MSDFLRLSNKIIKWNCSTLSVPVPAVKIAEPSEFATPTVKSAVSSDGRELLINRSFAETSADEPFMWLALSHECRHIWQVFNAEMFKDYRQSSALTVQEYNAQPEEVDAWAWSVIVVSEKFGVRPTLEKNFGAAVWAKIQRRARQIAAEGLF